MCYKRILVSLTETFWEAEIPYTYEEYHEHLCQMEEFPKSYERYSVLHSQSHAFRNTQIRFRESECVLISKSKASAIHFVIRHPKMVQALENSTPPMGERDMD